jgi:pyruvate/2-oxoglutarate dehydrogenase complex dihydrolipoamide acyltransferase (E2) component
MYLYVWVYRDAGVKGLRSISQDIGGFEDSLFAEDDKIDVSKMAIGTFSIHNLGMMMMMMMMFS